MLLEFSVSNFRSFRERQTFQMTAAPRLGKKQNTVPAEVAGERLPALLKVSAIYGGNASGKSSFILALAVIGKLVGSKPDAAGQPLPVSPFRFDQQLLDEPSRFEVHFIASGMRYEYRIAATAERIVEEALTSYPKGKEQLLYSRRHVDKRDEYEFGAKFEGDQMLWSVWRRLTGPRSTFIAQAVANSDESLRQLFAPFKWLSVGIFVLPGTDHLSDIGRNLPSRMAFSSQIASFLQEVDIPVSEITFERSGEAADSDDGLNAEQLSEKLLEEDGKTTLTHVTSLGSARFDFSEESRGTQNLIGFWAPWQLTTMHRDDPDSYRVIVIDELDSSLHPEIVEYLVSKHISSTSNTQLIFTTHDTHLMSTRLLRRDQFWLTDRNKNGATRLSSIHSVAGRESEDVEKRYYEGRYRGLPVRRGS